MEAVLDFAHLLLPLRGEPALRRSPAEHEGHAGAVVDLNARGAGHAVAAPPAEVPGELLPVPVDDRLALRRHLRGIFDAGQELIQLPVVLNAPDGDHGGLCLHEGGRRQPVPDEAAGQGLHGDEAHVRRPALVHQLQLLGTGEVAEGKLEGVVQPGVDGLVGHGQPVVGDGDVPDLPLALGLQGGLVQAVLPAGLGAEGGVVELVDVDIVGPKGAQALLQVLPHPLRRHRRGLGGDDDFVPHAGKGGPHLLLAVRVGPGGVEVVHAPVVGPAEQGDGLLLGDALNGQTAEALLADHQLRAAQSYCCHCVLLLCVKGSLPTLLLKTGPPLSVKRRPGIFTTGVPL